ncbi:MAG: biopolymer transporter ExbD [bacterium]
MRRKTRFPLMAEINITPLTDVMLVLLIIFMVSSSFILQEKSLGLTLPKADGNVPASRSNALVLDIDRGGALFMDGKPATEDALKERLRVLKKHAPSPSILLRADESSRYQKFVSILEILSRADCGNISLAARPRGKR